MWLSPKHSTGLLTEPHTSVGSSVTEHGDHVSSTETLATSSLILAVEQKIIRYLQLRELS